MSPRLAGLAHIARQQPYEGGLAFALGLAAAWSLAGHTDARGALGRVLTQRETAVADARAALEFRAQRIEQLAQSEATLTAQLTQAKATIEVQQGEIVRLQSRLYTVEAENRDLMARAEAAEAGARSARVRISELEEKLETLQRKLSLGPDGGF